MEKEKSTKVPSQEQTQPNNPPVHEIKDWKKETDPIKRALKKPLLWFYPPDHLNFA